MTDKRWSAISVLAALVSIGVAIYAVKVQQDTIKVQQDISGSGYRAKEAVKYDTVKLLSTLRSLIHKGLVAEVNGSDVDFAPEKKAISDFMNSSSGYAYLYWAYKKSSEKERSNGGQDEWWIFYYYLVTITIAKDISDAAKIAVEANGFLDELQEEDISEIADFNYEIEKAISLSKDIGDHDLFSKHFIKILEEKSDIESFESQLSCLKEKEKIEDPNIDLFWAVIKGNADLVKEALDNGANVNITDKELLSKYKEELENC